MKTFFLILISILLLLHFSCEQDNKPTQVKTLDSIEIITDTIAINLPPCIHPGLADWADTAIIINNNDDYQKLDRDKGCQIIPKDTIYLPYVDFQNRTVLGSPLKYGSGRLVWERTFKKFNYLKEFEYHIKLTRYIGKIVEDLGTGHDNLYSVPKIPSDYKVRIIREYKTVVDTL